MQNNRAKIIVVPPASAIYIIRNMDLAVNIGHALVMHAWI